MKQILRPIFISAALLCLAASVAWAHGQSESSSAGPKTITLLTWNQPHYATTIHQWMSTFEKANPNVTVKWVDKKGTELPTYYQTQLAAGTAPDVVDLQGAVFYHFAAEGALTNLTPFYKKDPALKARFQPSILKAAAEYKGKYYTVPFYTPSTVLYYNKNIFNSGGIGSAPTTFNEFVSDTQKLTNGNVSGFLTLNFGWLYWPLFRVNGVTILNSSRTQAAFNTPAGVKTLATLADLTSKGDIARISWTGRWVGPNSAFGAGDAAMFNAHITALRAFESSSNWTNAQTVGIAPFPGMWSVPNYHGFAITASSKHPNTAWNFIKLITDYKWARTTATVLGTLTGNAKADASLINSPTFAKDHPLVAKNFQVDLSEAGHLTGFTGSAQDPRIKAAVYSSLEKALFGEVSPSKALSGAQQSVNSILGQ